MRRWLLTWLFPSAMASAQTGTFSTIYPNDYTGDYAPVLRASDGNFYGINGYFLNLFQVTPSGVVTDLRSNPQLYDLSKLCMEGSDGYLYGTTFGGAAPGIIKMDFKGNAINTVMLPTATNVYYTPGCPVMASDGNLYGGAAGGGTYNAGFLYQIVSATGQVNIIYNFTGNYSLDGYGPTGPLLQASDGNLYGITTDDDGAYEEVVFRFSAADGLVLLPASSANPLLKGRTATFTRMISAPWRDSRWQARKAGVRRASPDTTQPVIHGRQRNILC